MSPSDPLPNDPLTSASYFGVLTNGGTPPVLSPTDATHSIKIGNNENNMSSSESLTTSDCKSPKTEALADTSELIDLSPNTSMIVNSQLTPEEPSVSPLSSPITYNPCRNSTYETTNSDDKNLAGFAEELRLVMNTPSR